MKSKNKIGIKGIALMLCVSTISLLFAACSNDVGNLASGIAAAGKFPVTIGQVKIKTRPTKAIVLSPSLADVILALNYEGQVVAVTNECSQDEYEKVKKVSPISAKEMISLETDLVITDQIDDTIKTEIEKANIPVLVLRDANSREDFERLYSEVSSAFSGEGAGGEAGIKVATEIFTTLDDISRFVKTDTITTACYLYDAESKAVTGDLFGNVILTYSGLTNVFNAVQGGVYDPKILRVSNPNIIFCAEGKKEDIMNSADFKNLQAVKDNKVFELSSIYMERQGRTVIIAASEITGLAFPDLLKETSVVVTDPTKKIDLEAEKQSNSSKSSSSEGSETSSANETSSAKESSAATENSSSSSSKSTSSKVSTSKIPGTKMGDSGDDVVQIQERLTVYKFLISEYDGHFGEVTEKAVKDFQKKNGLDETGVVDTKTKELLFSDKAKAK